MGTPRFSLEALDGILLLLTQTEAEVKSLQIENRHLRAELRHIMSLTESSAGSSAALVRRVYAVATAAIAKPPALARPPK